jgi:hypothetical protein
MNSITAVLRVFRDSSLITPQGEFKISRVFPDGRAARKARYYYHSAGDGVTIYARRGKSGGLIFAAVDE